MYILVKNNKIVFSADDTLELRAIIQNGGRLQMKAL